MGMGLGLGLGVGVGVGMGVAAALPERQQLAAVDEVAPVVEHAVRHVRHAAGRAKV